MLARFVAAALIATLGWAAQPRAEIFHPPAPVTVQVRPGVTVKYLVTGGSEFGRPPSQAVILFAGGNGLLNLGPSSTIGTNLSGNFLIRSRAKFAARGLLVASVDTPNQVPIDGIVRLSEQYARDMSVVIADVRQRLSKGGKVWIVGTSSGTLSVAGVASQLPQPPIPVVSNQPFERTDTSGLPDGAVFTSTQTTLVKGLCGRTVFNAKLAVINVPSQVVTSLGDRCRCMPPKSAAKVITALTHAPAKEHITVARTLPPKSPDPCQAYTPHGFFGVEDKVVGIIADWISAH